MDKSDLQELLATLYLRLNGYFTSGFIAHASENNLTEVDILAVRFPYNSEPEREVEPSRWLQIPQHRIDILVSEVKGMDNPLKFNPPLRNNPESIKKVIRWIGLFSDNEIDQATRRLSSIFSTQIVQTPENFRAVEFPEKNLSIRSILFAPDRGIPARNQLRYVPGNEMIEFIWRCLCPDHERVLCDIHYDFGLWSGFKEIVLYFKERKANGATSGTMQDLYNHFGV